MLEKLELHIKDKTARELERKGGRKGERKKKKRREKKKQAKKVASMRKNENKHV